MMQGISLKVGDIFIHCLGVKEKAPKPEGFDAFLYSGEPVKISRSTQFVVDLSGGQLAVATVIRSNGDTQGLEFEQHLV
ncbi:MAG: hypothetical protein AAFR66_25135, partial [Bacteroidota bacterium]